MPKRSSFPATLPAFALAIASLLALGCAHVSAQSPPQWPEYPAKVANEKPAQVDWVPVLRALKPLSKPRGQRWPMICWENAPFTTPAPELVKDELARGFVPHIRLDEKMIPIAQAIQAAGGPVIMMEGQGGPFPYNRAGNPSEWAHQLPADYKGKKSLHACIGVLTGWRVRADETRRILRAFKDAGVNVDAAWLDWEGEPSALTETSYAQAKVCARCKDTLPDWALESSDHYIRFGRQLGADLLSTYLAAPIAEVFPGCATTNWMCVASTAQNPVLGWESHAVPPLAPGLFTMTNPVAYGNSVFYLIAWPPSKSANASTPTPAPAPPATQPETKPTREQVDQLFMHLLLRGVSVNQQNIQASTPWVRSAPWVARWCPDDESPTIPMMSRERYREALRHIWLRGAVTMQVFNANRPGYRATVIAEVEDAHAVYDESLAWNDFILGGSVMNLQSPALYDDGVIWSGMRLKDRAVVRVFKQGGGEGSVTLTPWPEHPTLTVKLNADANGTTYFLHADAGKVVVKR